MTVDEIFEKLISHMQQGFLLHDEITQAYNFLGLYGYSKCHDYHYVEENYNCRKLYQYYLTHYHKLLKITSSVNEIIPTNWYKYTALQVDSNTRQQSIKMLLDQWIKWEQKTKSFYQTMYKELISIDNIAAALYLESYIEDVDKELKYAETELIKLQAIDYDILTIMDWQPQIEKQFNKKLKKIY